MKLGFTGTREGMTPLQREVVRSLLNGDARPGIAAAMVTELHHGDCIGSDSTAHDLALLVGLPRIVVHPPSASFYRAFRTSPLLPPERTRSEARPPKPYLDRDRDIVNETDRLIATPKGMTEERRSGTWATVRYARLLARPIIIVYPDGHVSIEHAGRVRIEEPAS